MRRTALTCLIIIMASTAAALAVRPAWPVNETRYLGVAWGMWERSDFLLPRLAGALYTDKPPLLFWLMHAGWAVFGVNAWWPRLIGPLAALGCLWLTARLARRLFPAGPAPAPAVAALAPLMLCGCLLFVAWSTFVMFDVLLVGAALLALLGLLSARQDGGARGWLLFALGLGTGFLLKGPVLLVHVLPVALAVRWWSPSRPGGRGAPSPGGKQMMHTSSAGGPATHGSAWALRLLLALLLGVALALLWVIPAGLAGGPAYRDALLWGQASSRLANNAEVPHAEPWWFYMAMLPLMLIPWSLWPRLWRAVRAAGRSGGAAAIVPAAAGVNGVRFCLAWALPALVLLSVIGSKQEQYLLPELPAFSLLGAALLVRHATAGLDMVACAGGSAAAPGPRREALLPGLLLAACGVALIFAAQGWSPLDGAQYAGTSALAGFALLGAGLVIAITAPPTLTSAVTRLACICAALFIAVHLGAPPAPLVQRDLRSDAARVATLQHDGRPLAYLGRYRAQYDFYGRLGEPIANVPGHEVAGWFEQHPDGVLIARHREPADKAPASGLRLVETMPSGEQLWENAPPEATGVRSPGPR